MNIVNLTPHTITVVLAAGTTAELLPSGAIAHAREHSAGAEPIGGIPTSFTTYRGVDGLPDPSDGTWYVVSSVAAQAAHDSGRTCRDLLVPGGQVRGERGEIIGCRSLIRWQPSRSHHAYLESLRFWADERIRDEFGYTPQSEISDQAMREIAQTAEYLVASLSPSPGDSTCYAVWAIQSATRVLEISRSHVYGRMSRQIAKAIGTLSTEVSHDAAVAVAETT